MGWKEDVLITARSQNYGTVPPQGPEGTQREVLMEPCLKTSSLLPSQRSGCSCGKSAARSASSSPSVNREVMPTQRRKRTLKFHSDRRWWHLLSSADMPSRNAVQGQLALLPSFLVQWNSSCQRTNLCKVGFVQTKKAPYGKCPPVSQFQSDLILYQWKSLCCGISPLLNECKALSGLGGFLLHAL